MVQTFGVIVFPGTNCDTDTYHVLESVLHVPVQYVWHESTSLPPVDCLILPGGFSYGDYLRAGAIARFSPIMRAVARFAADGGTVLGICNGFQVLCEAGLLPGALLRNATLQFRCGWTYLRVEHLDTRFTRAIPRLANGAPPVLRMPIAHGEGRYFADPDTLRQLDARGQVVLRYCAPDGTLSDAANPNGSVEAIAGIRNAAGNVFGLMPHPERCSEDELGGVDGRLIFESIIAGQAPPVGGRMLVTSASGREG